MGASSWLHTLAASFSAQGHPVPTEWVPEPVYVLWKSGKYLGPAGHKPRLYI